MPAEMFEKVEKIHLGSLVEELKKGHYVIPDFQREFEWNPWDVLDLLRSIFMHYYVGTLLLWKGSEENFKLLSCENLYGFSGKSDPQHIVLDGQQRLTAIYYSFFRPSKPFPKRKKVFVYLLRIDLLLQEDYESAFTYQPHTQGVDKLLKNKKMQFEQHTFPLGEMQEGSWGTSDWIKAYRDYWRDRAEVESSITLKDKYVEYSEYAKSFKNLLEDLFNKFYLGYIELDRNIEVGKVCDIFTQINSRGVRLDIFDLLNAILRPRDIFLKEMWRQSEANLSFTDTKKMKIYILQVMSILEQTYCSAKYLYYLVPESVKTIKKSDGTKEQIVLIKDKEEFLEKWNHSVQALEKAIKALRNPRDFGAIHPAFVPYPSIIPAFASIKAFVDNSDSKNKVDMQTKIRKWYWSSIFTNRYSSSVESTSSKDFQDMKRWFEENNAQPEVINEFLEKYKSLDLLNENIKGNAIYNAIFNLYIINEARDWHSFDLPEYDSLDDHHIVPISGFKSEAGLLINSILNKTPLSFKTNRHIINNRMPNEYLQEMFENNDKDKVYNVLASHLISKKATEILLRNPFTKSDYLAFLDERRKTIIQAIENRLIKEAVPLAPVLKDLNEQIERVELGLRALISKKLASTPKPFTSVTPSNIQTKVNERIEKELKKYPHFKEADFDSFDKKLVYFDLQEYLQLIINANCWQYFEQLFKSKERLTLKFNQLAGLRNAIRHSREVNDVDRLEGEAAIRWFDDILKVYE